VKKVLAAFLFLVGSASLALARIDLAPEIDAGSAVSALALISGAVLVIRGRKRV